MSDSKICYRSLHRYKYQLVEPYTHDTGIQGHQGETQFEYVVLEESGTITFKKGYAWDGPSGPTIDSKNFMRSSLVHDGFYQLIREKILPYTFRKTADELIRKICRQDGMSAIRAWWVYHGLRIAGGPSAKPKPVAPPVCAP